MFVAGSIRHFIVDGLRTTFPKATVTAVPTEIRQLQARKVEGRAGVVEIYQRGVYASITNTGILIHPQATLLAIRHTHKQMHIGIHESDARQLVARALADTGLKDGGCLTLFGATCL